MHTVRKWFSALLVVVAGLGAFQVSAVEAKTEKIDVNTATAEELDKLPGVGETYNKKIIAGRPYKTDEDLVKAGIPQATVDKIAPLITFGKAHKPKEEKKEDAKTVVKEEKKEEPKSTKADKKDGSKDDVAAKVPPKKGMVWVNTDSKVYHKEGDRWYGKTKVGEFMTEEDAIKVGARPSKEGGPKDEKKDEK